MTNKTLAIALSIVIIVAAGVAAMLLYKNNNSGLKMPDSLNGEKLQSQNEDNSQVEVEENNNKATPEPTKNSAENPAASPTLAAKTTDSCTRDFNEQTLKTAKVAIANRQVEINVKDYGKILVEFFDKDAPKTVENFLRLTNSGYYNCLTFHRIGKDFMIQGGDPNGNGSGGFSAFGPTFADEINPNSDIYKTGYAKGVLAMANRGQDTNGSQFFIMLANVPLQPSYTIFGKVISGQEVVDKIGKAEINPNLNMNPNGSDGTPKVPIVMQSVKIIK